MHVHSTVVLSNVINRSLCMNTTETNEFIVRWRFFKLLFDVQEKTSVKKSVKSIFYNKFSSCAYDI